MLDRMLLPKYKDFSIKLYEYNVDRIQVFYQQYNESENPVVLLLYQNDALLKHVFSLYENKDIKKSTHCFISLRNFLKFSNEFQIIPNLCSTSQIIKLFRTFQKNNEEILEFRSYILLLCCIAHIGFNNPEFLDKYKGFYQKLWKFLERILQINNKISETVVLDRFLSPKP